MFREENFGHVNLVKILNHGLLKHYPDGEELPCYVIDMELGEQNLADYVAQCFSAQRDQCDHGIAELEIWDIVRQIASGTSYLHEKHMLYVPIKPENSDYPSPQKLTF